MCGIVGVSGTSPVNQLLYDALQLLQHCGQDAAGIATVDGRSFRMHKGNGRARDVFRTRNMRSLPGMSGIAQVRYPTQGSATNSEEAQPFYVNAPFGIVLAHNGNLTNWETLKEELFRVDRRHINTNSDSEVLLNVLAHELQLASEGLSLDPAAIFRAVAGVHRRVRGSYAVVAEIAGYGLLGFRDPFGIRPLVFGVNETDAGTEYMIASESVALQGNGFRLVRDVAPGEAIFVAGDGRFYSQQCADSPSLNPCIFEYVYLARPDSLIDGVSVYGARLRLGEYLADRVSEAIPGGGIDVVMPIPDSSRPAALELARKLGRDYREGFIKNRYIGRTFIMPGQEQRAKSVRSKLNAIDLEFRGKNVLLVDDSIVRGTTSAQIIEVARDAGAKAVYFASAAPPVRYPNVYGIDMPAASELVAAGRTEDEVARLIGADWLIYQDLADLERAVRHHDSQVSEFDTSCFSGHYVTGDVTPEYLARLQAERSDMAKAQRNTAGAGFSLKVVGGP